MQHNSDYSEPICGIDMCIDTLQKGSNWFQITYRALNIIWLCSLSCPSNPSLCSKPLAIILSDLLRREEQKEKIVSMAVCITSNVSCQPKFLDMILPLGVLRSVQQNMLRVWSDTDIEDMLKTLLSKLQAHVDGKGTVDEFPAASDPPASSPMSCPVSGYGSFTFSNDINYTGEWATSEPHGRGKMEYTDGSVYEGNFSNGLKEGTGVFSGGQVVNGPATHTWEVTRMT
jgi:hypothetical protein